MALVWRITGRCLDMFFDWNFFIIIYICKFHGSRKPGTLFHSSQTPNLLHIDVSTFPPKTPGSHFSYHIHPFLPLHTAKWLIVSPLPTCGPSLGSGVYLGF